MQNFMSEKPTSGGQRYDRDGLYRWAGQRLGTVLAVKSGGAEILADQAGFFNVIFKAIEAEGFDNEEFLRTEPRSQKPPRETDGDCSQGSPIWRRG